jgi:pimeloyl-ACP methyl ester carboxylesterase
LPSSAANVVATGLLHRIPKSFAATGFFMAMIDVGGAAVEFAQSGAGPDLLLLHSLLTDLTAFERIVPTLQKTHRVSCVNLPGFGASAPVPFDSVAGHADHVARVIAALELPDTTTVFGNGFGAFVALELAIRHGRHFGKLCAADVVATFPDAAKPAFRTMAARVRDSGMAAVLDIAIGRMFPPAFQAHSPDVVAMRKRRLSGVDPECFARACLALAELDLRERLPSIHNETLVLCGALDQTTPAELSRQVARAIAGANFEEIPDCGHCPMLEQPEVLIAALNSFAPATKTFQ